MINTYVPILRWKQGERIALNNLSATGRIDVTPHLVISQAQYGDTKLPKAEPKNPPKKPPVTAADYLAKQLLDAWGPTKFYLDAADLPGTPANHHLDNIGASANAAGLHLVPSVKRSSPPAYHAAIQRRIAADNRGTALRISLGDLTSMNTWFGSWYCPPADTDLIIDVANSAANVLALGVPAFQAFANLYQAQAWRSVTVAGGNIPAMLTGYNVGPTLLPRAELDLWNALNAHGLGYNLDFGDYATIGPDASTDDIPGPVPINAKYTPNNTHFLVLHGVKTKGPGSVARDVQYRSYAAQIIQFAGRIPLATCWGDGQINAITNPGNSPGSPATWVSYSVNRHIELTRSQLP